MCVCGGGGGGGSSHGSVASEARPTLRSKYNVLGTRRSSSGPDGCPK